MRFGQPIARQGRTEFTTFATVKLPSGATFLRKWKGSSPSGIHKAAREKYRAEFPGCTVTFSPALGVNSYGAH